MPQLAGDTKNGFRMMDKELITIAEELAGSPVKTVARAGHGGNSRIYKVETESGIYALKQYPSLKSDPRDRFTTERRAIKLMHSHGIKSLPNWISGEAPYALMSWVEGDIIKNPQGSDIDEAAIFLRTLHDISLKTIAGDFTPASEACMSGKAIAEQLEKRTATLMAVASEDKRLMSFLSKEFLPAFTQRLAAAKEMAPDFAFDLPHASCTLIPADFGFHNILKEPDGRLIFIDFEYFGWDDPVKLLCDFLLHPAMQLTPQIKQQFLAHGLAIYGDQIKPRFDAYFPLFGLRWALILLNEFIPARWQARVAAQGTDGDWEIAKTAQLEKAQAMVKQSEKFA